MTGLYLRFHGWRGIALTNVEPDLFSYVFRLGFCTLYVCKTCLLDAYRKLRATMMERVRIDEEAARHDREGR